MRNILIYGATSAMAVAFARCFAKEKASFYLVSRSQEKGQAIADDLQVRGAAHAEAHSLDFSNFADHEIIWQSALEALGTIDVVLVAHGEMGDQEEGQNDYQHAEEVLRTNFLSVVSLVTPIANHFEKERAGTIAVIASVAGDRGRQSNYIYGTAKGAVTTFLQGLRNRLHPSGVKVLTIKPGFVATPMTAHLDQGPLFASPEKVGAGIYEAVKTGKNEVYLPGYWRLIMSVIKGIPEPIFKRLKL
tara:strand:- start:179 stop:916 length:738 start_codon:yes stop_codon:yes gene_type:complete